MAKKLVGIVTSTKMTDSIVVEVTRRTPHTKYRKLIKSSKKYVVALDGKEVVVGDTVEIVETKKMAKNKFFKVGGKVK